MTSNLQPRAGNGTFGTIPPTAQELPDLVTGEIGLYDDVRANIEQDGYAFINESTNLDVNTVYSGANGVIIGTDADDNYVATVEFTDVNMVSYAYAMNGWKHEEDGAFTEEAIAWLDRSAPAITAFLEIKGVQSTGFEWDDDRLTVTVPLIGEVNFENAGIALDNSDTAAYLRDGLLNQSKEDGLSADMYAFINEYRRA